MIDLISIFWRIGSHCSPQGRDLNGIRSDAGLGQGAATVLSAEPAMDSEKKWIESTGVLWMLLLFPALPAHLKLNDPSEVLFLAAGGRRPPTARESWLMTMFKCNNHEII
jgi:hypothetical protein